MGWNHGTATFRVFLIAAALLAVWDEPLCCSAGLGRVQLLPLFTVESHRLVGRKPGSYQRDRVMTVTVSLCFIVVLFIL